jgi:protein TonB
MVLAHTRHASEMSMAEENGGRTQTGMILLGQVIPAYAAAHQQEATPEQPEESALPVRAKPVAEKTPIITSPALVPQPKEKQEPYERQSDGTSPVPQKPAALSGVDSGPGAGSVDTALFGGLDGPSFKHFVKPNYPAQARRQGLTGDVLLRVLIDADGRAAQVEIYKSAHESLARSAREAVLRSTFHPLHRNGAPVSCWTMLPVIFTLERG